MSLRQLQECFLHAVFNFVANLLQYSASPEEYALQLRTLHSIDVAAKLYRTLSLLQLPPFFIVVLFLRYVCCMVITAVVQYRRMLFRMASALWSAFSGIVKVRAARKGTQVARTARIIRIFFTDAECSSPVRGRVGTLVKSHHENDLWTKVSNQ